MKKMITGLAAIMMVTFAIAQPPAKPGKEGKEGFRKEGRMHRGPGGPDGAGRAGFGPHKGPGRGLPFRELNLTDQQKDQVKKINEDFHKQMKDLNAKEDITVKQQRTQRASLQKAHKTNLENVLTADQKAKLAKMKEDGKKRMDEMAAKRLDRMKEHLQLSDEQVAKIKASEQKQKAQAEAIFKNENLSRESKRDQLMALRSETKKTLDNVLTAEQKTKLESERKERGEKFKHFRERQGNRSEVK